jgi:Skp family chaperone for outer membrane proteins
MENETDIKLESLTEEQLETIIQERDLAKSLAAKAEAEKNGVVEELKTLRAKREEIPRTPNREDGTNVEEIIDAKLKQAEASLQAKALEESRNRARAKFLAEHKEFLPENDVSGIRNAALESKLSRFNLASAKTEDDALEILNDAYELLSRRETVDSSNGGLPPQVGNANRYASGGTSLNAKELGTISRLGWTKEKFIDMKIKHPELVSELFK